MSPVSIHAPAQGATAWKISGVLGSFGFNPRPRAGGDECRSCSIWFRRSFQSTPPRRGRHDVPRSFRHRPAFQSTPPRRGRLSRELAPENTPWVSIHAPAQGATGPGGATWFLKRGFNPRPRAGGDLRKSHNFASVCAFQSTPPRRGRPNSTIVFDGIKMFQSTPPRRGRPNRFYDSFRRCSVSIHAPAQGATRETGVPGAPGWRFNPRPRAGGDGSGQPTRTAW